MKAVDIIYQLFSNIGGFLGIFSRVTGFLVTIPIFSTNNIPSYIKIGLSLLVSLIVFPTIEVAVPIAQTEFFQLMILIVKEILTGLILGFICYLFFSIVYLVGHIIDMELGFAMANVISPENETEIPLTANLLYMLASLIFLSINGHHSFFRGLISSFRLIPLGSLNINYLMIDKLISIVMNTFVIAFKMGGPVLVAIFLTNILLGILARTMPQMNVFVVGMPLKILVGFIIMAITIPLYGGVFEYVYDSMFEGLSEFITTIIRG